MMVERAEPDLVDRLERAVAELAAVEKRRKRLVIERNRLARRVYALVEGTSQQDLADMMGVTKMQAHRVLWEHQHIDPRREP